MKTKMVFGFMLLLCMFFVVDGLAQSRPHIPFKNGHWFYTIGQIDAMTEISCIEIETVKDTLIAGELIHVFDVYRKRGNTTRNLVSTEYILERNDTIWVKEANKTNYLPLYSFSSNLGDTFCVSKNKFKPNAGFFSLASDSLKPLMYWVVSKDSIWMGGSWRRRIGTLNFENGNELNWCFGITDTCYFIEGIGASTYFFGQSRYVTAATNKTILRCFNNDSITIKFNNNTEPCDYSILLGTHKNVGIPFQIHFSNENIEVIGPLAINYTYKIYSINGQEISSGKLESTLSLVSLPLGIYVFHLYSSDQNVYTNKFIKQ